MAGAHTSVMALAELTLKFVDGDVKSLGYEGGTDREEHNLCSVTSFHRFRRNSPLIPELYFDKDSMLYKNTC